MKFDSIIIYAAIAALVVYLAHTLREKNDTIQVLKGEVTLLTETVRITGQQIKVISAADKSNFAELKASNDDNENLRRAVADSSKRLYVRATCPMPAAAPATSVDDDKRAELDPASRPDYFALREGLGRVNAKLNMCQDYADAVQAR